MAQTATKSSPAKKGKATAPRRRTGTSKPATAPRRGAGASKPPTALDKTTKLSEEVLDSVEKGQRAAIEAVHKFVDTVDQALPGRGERPSKGQEIVDAAMEMADRLVHTQYEFVRKVIDSAAKSVSGPNGQKRDGKK